jgi:hypothetical protein
MEVAGLKMRLGDLVDWELEGVPLLVRLEEGGSFNDRQVMR